MNLFLLYLIIKPFNKMMNERKKIIQNNQNKKDEWKPRREEFGRSSEEKIRISSLTNCHVASYIFLMGGSLKIIEGI